MSMWILPVALIVGVVFLLGFFLYLTHGLDEYGEPLEYRE